MRGSAPASESLVAALLPLPEGAKRIVFAFRKILALLEPEMGNVIGSLSQGASRKFRIRHNATRETMTFSVSNGTLIIMARTMQHFWKHDVPKTNENVGERINLTFRKITDE